MKRRIIRIAQFQAVLLTVILLIARFQRKQKKIRHPTGNMTGVTRFNAEIPC